MYLYDGCRDPVQKITGDAYRRHCSLERKSAGMFSGGHCVRHLDYELLDTAILERLPSMTAPALAAELGVHEATIIRRAVELGFDYDALSARWRRTHGEGT